MGQGFVALVSHAAALNSRCGWQWRNELESDRNGAENKTAAQKLCPLSVRRRMARWL